MHPQSHRSDPRILGRQTLERDHRVLARLLHPGHSVLDVGCGTGVITMGIAKAVGPTGKVVALDRDLVLIQSARDEYPSVANLEFVCGETWRRARRA